jgi:autotransporter-associated beta strand protein
VIVLNSQNTWMGTTTINLAQAGVVRLGTNNALPTGTDLVFGTGTNNAGALDLAGFDQSVKSLRSDTSGMVNGIANTAATLQGVPAVLTVTGNAVTTFSGTIGVPANTTNLPGANDNIALVLAASHTGELTLTAANTYNGGTTLNGGVLAAAADNNLGTATGPLNFGGGTLKTLADLNSTRPINVNMGGGNINTNGFNSTMTGPIGGPGTLTKLGAGQLAVTNVRSGGLDIDQGEMKVNIGPAASTPEGLSDVETFAIAGGPTAPTARLDLTNNAMIIGATPADSEVDVKGYISSGYAGGSWSGQGIASSSADRGTGTYGLGYAQAGLVSITNFLGVPVQATDTLIRFTLYGDANIDGIVNLQDFNRLAANFGATNATWRQGNFNYDNIVNLQDFNRLAANFGLVASPGGPTPADWAALASAVPEPSSLLLLGLGSGLLRRRRNR